MTELVRATGFPITLTLMGLGAYPASDPQFIGMLGMHGTEADLAMHGCDLMIALGSRFDDQVTGRLDRFSRLERGAHRHRSVVDQQKRSGRRGDGCGCRPGRTGATRLLARQDCSRMPTGWRRGGSRSRCGRRPTACATGQNGKTIKPQYAIQRLYQLTKDRETYITTEVGQHQMWAAQHYKFEIPRRWMTSGGLRHHGLRLPGGHGRPGRPPRALVIDIAGEASWVMNMQEMSTIVQYRPVKSFILNNSYMGMVEQWQEFFRQPLRRGATWTACRTS